MHGGYCDQAALEKQSVEMSVLNGQPQIPGDGFCLSYLSEDAELLLLVTVQHDDNASGEDGMPDVMGIHLRGIRKKSFPFHKPGPSIFQLGTSDVCSFLGFLGILGHLRTNAPVYYECRYV